MVEKQVYRFLVFVGKDSACALLTCVTGGGSVFPLRRGGKVLANAPGGGGGGHYSIMYFFTNMARMEKDKMEIQFPGGHEMKMGEHKYFSHRTQRLPHVVRSVERLSYGARRVRVLSRTCACVCVYVYLWHPLHWLHEKGKHARKP